jgi:hypothetical protein
MGDVDHPSQVFQQLHHQDYLTVDAIQHLVQ